ncbi:hypothetical protein RN001_011341 [Aquatica leii]|uniref:CHHC U11-48K-type domain-containing protein n=1 Tax=Aquatica leii TaxID=1421715 RepID=A0AAN7SQR3_9COLE|nr:hypothetical protein RN001_011341 [Aquatica leii]
MEGCYDIRDIVVVCPFDKTHCIAQSRLQRHIIKCSRNFPKHFVCHFNALHRFLTKEEQVQHIMLCPNKSFTQPWRYVSRSEKNWSSSAPVHTPNAQTFNMELEDWSDEYRYN